MTFAVCRVGPRRISSARSAGGRRSAEPLLHARDPLLRLHAEPLKSILRSPRKVSMPSSSRRKSVCHDCAAVFAIGDRFQSDLLLFGDQCLDFPILDVGRAPRHRSRRARVSRARPSAQPGEASCRHGQPGRAAGYAARFFSLPARVQRETVHRRDPVFSRRGPGSAAHLHSLADTPVMTYPRRRAAPVLLHHEVVLHFVERRVDRLAVRRLAGRLLTNSTTSGSFTP